MDPLLPHADRSIAAICGRNLSDDESVISPDKFEHLRAAICASGPASSGDNLLGMEMDACAFLGDPAYADDDPGLWQGMSIHRSEGSEWLINAHARGKPEDAAPVSTALARIWEQRLSYNYQSAHIVVSSPGAVTLLAVTQISPGGIWVTAKIEVALS